MELLLINYINFLGPRFYNNDSKHFFCIKIKETSAYTQVTYFTLKYSTLEVNVKKN